MKTSIIFLFLAVSASSVLSSSINDAEVAAKQFADLLVETLTKIMNASEIEDKGITQAMNSTRTGSVDTAAALNNGTYDEEAIKAAIIEFDEIITGIAKHMNYVGEDLPAAIKNEADAYLEIIQALLHGKTRQLYEAIVKEILAYGEIMVILSEAAHVDVTELIIKSKDALCAVYIGWHNTRNNYSLSVQGATEQFTDKYVQILTEFMDANIIHETSVNEAMSKAVTEFKTAVDAANNGIFDGESASASAAGWTKAALKLINYTHCNVEQVSMNINNAADAFQEATRASVFGSFNEVVQGIYKAMTGYVGVMGCFGENIGSLNITEELDESWDAYSAIFNGLYDNRISDAN